MLMYFTYLIFILVRVVHILLVTLTVSEEIKYLDLIHSLLYILVYAIGFFAPYYAATWLHVACQRYHKKMIDAYLEVQITEKVQRGDGHSYVFVTYLCKPGDEIEYKAPSRPIDNSEANETSHLLRNSPILSQEEDSTCRDKLKQKYKLYCQESLVTQGTNIINMTKTSEFDFVPSFLNISIPLDSPGYTFTILLTVIFVAFNFVD